MNLFTSSTRHVHNQHVLILRCRCNPVFTEPSEYLIILRFLRAVAYRWLARWLFGPMGRENTRPLPSCIYHKIRKEFQTHGATGYVSRQERADQNDLNFLSYIHQFSNQSSIKPCLILLILLNESKYMC